MCLNREWFGHRNKFDQKRKFADDFRKLGDAVACLHGRLTIRMRAEPKFGPRFCVSGLTREIWQSDDVAPVIIFKCGRESCWHL